ncbi:nicotinamide mononucleotide transporter [Pedobacter sp. UYP30]|uniref:nicotinamide riboside transporter PnuC n=1 Tax=Pedobacter sp. UYP30 TaxID=1756400 RepID=UPI003391A16A
MEQIISYFLKTSLLEWCGVFTGILCVYLAAKNIIWNWPFAIISVTIYIFIFFEAKLYADTGLQFYFLAMNIYGWYYWSKERKSAKEPRRIGLIKQKELLLSLLGLLIFTGGLGFYLHQQTDAASPYLDSFCTAISLVAQIFLARKVLENWLMWIFVDLIYVGLYIYKGLYATSIMYGIYIYIASMGYLEWKKTHSEQTN